LFVVGPQWPPEQVTDERSSVQVAQSLPSAKHCPPEQLVLASVGATQAPLPSHKDLFWRTPDEQVWAAQTVESVGKVQALRLVDLHSPAHLPSPPQAFLGVDENPQEPSFAHASQFPSHLPSQHTPSTQKVVEHCSFLLQALPLARSDEEDETEPPTDDVPPVVMVPPVTMDPPVATPPVAAPPLAVLSPPTVPAAAVVAVVLVPPVTPPLATGASSPASGVPTMRVSLPPAPEEPPAPFASTARLDPPAAVPPVFPSAPAWPSDPDEIRWSKALPSLPPRTQIPCCAPVGMAQVCLAGHCPSDLHGIFDISRARKHPAMPTKAVSATRNETSRTDFCKANLGIRNLR
jgi:hypothetical protein